MRWAHRDMCGVQRQHTKVCVPALTAHRTCLCGHVRGLFVVCGTVQCRCNGVRSPVGAAETHACFGASWYAHAAPSTCSASIPCTCRRAVMQACARPSSAAAVVLCTATHCSTCAAPAGRPERLGSCKHQAPALAVTASRVLSCKSHPTRSYTSSLHKFLLHTQNFSCLQACWWALASREMCCTVLHCAYQASHSCQLAGAWV